MVRGVVVEAVEFQNRLGEATGCTKRDRGARRSRCAGSRPAKWNELGLGTIGSYR